MGHLIVAPLDVFYSYSHKDAEFLKELLAHLSLLKREGYIRSWHDRNITAGKEFDGEIDGHINDAHIILLLISADFIDSDYCYGRELMRAMERHEVGEARVIPIILRDCDWHTAPFGKLKALPEDGKPVTSWNNIDEAFTNIAKGIRSVVQELYGFFQKINPPFPSKSQFDVESNLAERMPNITFAELEVTCKAILGGQVPPATNYNHLDPETKMKRNGLTDNIRFKLTLGLGKASEVASYVTHMAMMDPKFPNRLKAGFVSAYKVLFDNGLRGDDLFLGLWDLACPDSEDYDMRTAGLAVLAYLFDKCEVFES